MAESWVIPTAAWLLTFAAHSTVLLGMALGIVALLGRRSAAVRERVLKLGILGSLATTSLHVAYDLEPFGGSLCLVRGYVAVQDVTPADPEQRFDPQDGVYAHAVGAPRPGNVSTVAIDSAIATDRIPCPCERSGGASLSTHFDGPSSYAFDEADSVGVAAGVVDSRGEGSRAPSASVDPGPSASAAEYEVASRPLPFIARLPWIEPVVVAWGLGGLFGLALLLRSWRRLHTAIADRSPLRDRSIDGWLHSWMPGREIRVTTCPRIHSPLSLGVLRPEICLPERVLDELAPEEQQALLAHELAHLERRDPTWLLICRVLENLFFFQPLLRSVRRRLFESAESLCDLRAAQRTGGQLALASCLTEVADWVSGGRRVPLTVAMATSRSEVGRRIEDLLDGERGVSTPRRWVPWGYGLALVFVPLLVPGASGSSAPSCVRGLEAGGPSASPSEAGGSEIPQGAGGEFGPSSRIEAAERHESSGSGVTNADSNGKFPGGTSSILGDLPSPVEAGSDPATFFPITESELACTRAADAFDGLLNDLDTEFAQLQGELHELRVLGATGPQADPWASTLARAERSLHTIGVRRARIRTVLTALRQGDHPAPSAPSREATQVPKEDLQE